MKQHRTQLEQARTLVLLLCGRPHEQDVDLLDAIVEAAQNPPPQGGADGSLDEPAWTALAKLASAARAYREARALAHHHTIGAKKP